MTDNEIVTFEDEMIQEATEAVAKGLDAGYTIESLLKTINRQKAEIENLNIELQAMRGAANSYKAEVERLQKIIVGFMDEVGTWSNKYDVDVSNIHKLPLLAKEDWNIRNNIKYEAIKEFAERMKKQFAIQPTYHKKTIIVCDIVKETIDKIVKEMVGD